MPIIGRLSVGPSAFALDPADVIAPGASSALIETDTLAPSSLVPCEFGELDMPFPNGGLGGGAYDASNATLYLTALAADPDNAAYNPKR